MLFAYPPTRSIHSCPGYLAVDVYDPHPEGWAEDMSDIAEFLWSWQQHKTTLPPVGICFKQLHEDAPECSPPTWAKRCRVKTGEQSAVILDVECIHIDHNEMVAVYLAALVDVDHQDDSRAASNVIGPAGVDPKRVAAGKQLAATPGIVDDDSAALDVAVDKMINQAMENVSHDG